MGKFLVSLSSKGGVGKSTISHQVLTSCLYEKYNKKHKLIEIDDNNITDGYTSSIFTHKSYKVENGIGKALEEMFNIFEDENIVLDIGGGNDTNKAIEAISSMGIDENVIYFIPILKNKSGMINFINTYKLIRKKSNSKIVVVLNQCKFNDIESIKNEFVYFFGSKEMNIKGVFEDIYSDNNLQISSLLDTNVYDLSEDYELTSYEIAKEDMNIPKFLKDEKDKGFEAFKKALGFVQVYNKCKDNHEKSFLGFYNDVKEII